MALPKLEALYSTTLETMQREGRLKGSEHVITDILPPQDGWGPRYLLALLLDSGVLGFHVVHKS
jgi:hypothetical protein